MCRWIVYRGKRLFLDSLLVKPKNSLINQAGPGMYTPHVTSSEFYNIKHHQLMNDEVNGDGFGVAWYSPTLKINACYKVTSPAWSDRNLQELSKVISSRNIFAHIRAASKGMVVNRENCHPFTYGQYTFMHNGEISNYRRIKRKLHSMLSDELYNMLQGTTDSETLFALFLNNLPDPNRNYPTETLLNALSNTMQQVLDLSMGAGNEPSPLNLALTDGDKVIVSRYLNSNNEDPPTLYYSQGNEFNCVISAETNEPVFHMTRGEPIHTVIVGSEPLTYQEDEWDLIPRNNFLIIEALKPPAEQDLDDKHYDDLKVELRKISF